LNYSRALGHSTTIEVNASCEEVFDYLKDPFNLGKWAFGCWEAKATEEEGLYMGTSLFSTEDVYFKIVTEEKLYLLDFHLGKPTSLIPSISLRVIPGSYYRRNDSFSLVKLDAWRDFEMDDARWHQLCACHETEILVIKSLIERSP
jgi:hypothetical protein